MPVVSVALSGRSDCHWWLSTTLAVKVRLTADSARQGWLSLTVTACMIVQQGGQWSVVSGTVACRVLEEITPAQVLVSRRCSKQVCVDVRETEA